MALLRVLLTVAALFAVALPSAAHAHSAPPAPETTLEATADPADGRALSDHGSASGAHCAMTCLAPLAPGDSSSPLASAAPWHRLTLRDRTARSYLEDTPKEPPRL